MWGLFEVIGAEHLQYGGGGVKSQRHHWPGPQGPAAPCSHHRVRGRKESKDRKTKGDVDRDTCTCSSARLCQCVCACVCVCVFVSVKEHDAHGKTQSVLMQITCSILSSCKLFKTYL